MLISFILIFRVKYKKCVDFSLKHCMTCDLIWLNLISDPLTNMKICSNVDDDGVSGYENLSILLYSSTVKTISGIGGQTLCCNLVIKACA